MGLFTIQWMEWWSMNLSDFGLIGSLNSALLYGSLNVHERVSFPASTMKVSISIM